MSLSPVLEAVPVPPAVGRVEALLARMTLEEKVGQMTQLTLEAVTAQKQDVDGGFAVDLDKVRQVLVERHVGSLLNVADAAMSVAQWRALIAVLQTVAMGETRLGIPVLYGIDAIHGANYTLGATLFPHSLSLAATWEPRLVEAAAAVTAQETRACGLPWNFAPVLDLGRQPYWSRFFETYGEDVLLATRMGEAAVRGYEGEGVGGKRQVAACAKHFLAYSFPLSGRDRSPAWIPPHVLREYFLPPFAAALQAGIRTVMVNSGEINGVPVHASAALLTTLLREELGFEGVLVTDWEDVIRLHTMHRVAATEREAVKLAVLAGIDLSMTPRSLDFQDHLLDLVRTGEIPASRIDASVRRILAMKAELGLFEDPTCSASADLPVGSDEAARLALEAARRSLVLLENRHECLPLPPATRLLLTGPAADSRTALLGPWSQTWQGDDERFTPAAMPTLRTTLEREGAALTVVPGCTFETVLDLDAVRQAAETCDVLLCAVGEPCNVEKPGDIDDLALSAPQRLLVETLLDTGKPVVLLLVTGRPRLLGDLADRAAAVLFVGRPGQAGAEAVAEVLFGRVNPAGRLPFTYPRHPGSIVAYDHKQSDRTGRSFGVGTSSAMDGLTHVWPFAHGLHYGEVTVESLQVSPTEVERGGSVTVEVRLHYAAPPGRVLPCTETVAVFVQDLYASLTPPVERLRAFETVVLQPGERRTVRVVLPVEALGFVQQDGAWTVEPGAFRVRVGPQEAAFTLV